MNPVGLWTWIGALVFAAVVLLFVLHEVRWKARRLRADIARLNEVGRGLTGLRAELTTTRGRINAIAATRASS